MKPLKTSFLPLLFLVLTVGGKAQVQQLTLQQACDYALQNSLQIKNADADIAIARQKIWETTAIGLPQVTGSVQYQNFLDIPTSLMPDFISPAVYGVLLQTGLIQPSQMPNNSETQFFPVKFGTQHNATASLTISQLIFSGQYIVGLQASKVFSTMSEQSYQKTVVDVRLSVFDTYSLILSLKENRNILDSNLTKFRDILRETREMQKQGFVDEIAVDQLELNVSNLDNATMQLGRQIEVAMNLLKFQMGMDLSTHIELTDKLENIVIGIKPELYADTMLKTSDNIDMQLMETQVKLQELNLKRERSAYLPTLAGVFSYSQKAMRDKFDFFEGDKDWFPTTLVGINLDVPIWSSGSRHAKIQQAKLNLLKANNSMELVSQSIQLQYQQARTAFISSQEKYAHEKKNLELSEKIFNKTAVKFKEGLASSMELTQTQMQFLTAQANFFAASLELINNKNKLEKLMSK